MHRYFEYRYGHDYNDNNTSIIAQTADRSSYNGGINMTRRLILMLVLIAVASVTVNDIPTASAAVNANWSTNLVLKYNSTVTVPASVQSALDVDISIDGPVATYTYVFLLIHENAYEANLGAINVISDGTSAGTNFTINGTKIDANIANLDPNKLVNLLNDIFGSENNDMLLKKFVPSNYTSGSFEGLESKNPGHYIVFTAVLSFPYFELVAFNQTRVTIGTQTLENIVISASSDTVNVGDTTLLTVNATNNFGETYAVDAASIIWTISGTGAGTLNNQTGAFTGTKEGIVDVIASYTEGEITRTNTISITYTPLDIPSPASITNLANTSYALTYINWTWIDSTDSDLSKVMVYLNSIFQTNISKGLQYYNATGLNPGTSYTISTRTVDIAGNINQTWVNHTATTNYSSGQTKGDLNRNGRRDTGDATLMLRTIVELPIPSQYQPVLPIGDMNCNNRIDTGDATLVLRDIVNLPIPRCWDV